MSRNNITEDIYVLFMFIFIYVYNTNQLSEFSDNASCNTMMRIFKELNEMMMQVISSARLSSSWNEKKLNLLQSEVKIIKSKVGDIKDSIEGPE